MFSLVYHSLTMMVYVMISLIDEQQTFGESVELKVNNYRR